MRIFLVRLQGAQSAEGTTTAVLISFSAHGLQAAMILAKRICKERDLFLTRKCKELIFRMHTYKESDLT